MLKTDLIAALAAKCDCSKTDAANFLENFSEIVKEEVFENNGTVSLVGVGTFKRKTTASRTGRNPKTGETITIPAKDKLTFSPAKDMKK